MQAWQKVTYNKQKQKTNNFVKTIDKMDVIKEVVVTNKRSSEIMEEQILNKESREKETQEEDLI